MPVEKKEYTVEFTYTDNDQMFLDHFLLTELQYIRVREFLSALGRSGDIADINGNTGHEDGDFISLYKPPKFNSFETLKKYWKDGVLITYGKNIGVNL